MARSPPRHATRPTSFRWKEQKCAFSLLVCADTVYNTKFKTVIASVSEDRKCIQTPQLRISRPLWAIFGGAVLRLHHLRGQIDMCAFPVKIVRPRKIGYAKIPGDKKIRVHRHHPRTEHRHTLHPTIGAFVQPSITISVLLQHG